MNDLQCHWELIAAKTVLRIAFSGYYAPGSQGNSVAGKMSDFVSRTIVQRQPSPVLFDLSQLDYKWGDAIFGIVVALLKAGWKPPLRCVCVVAEGETAQAVRPLFEPNWAFGCMGVQLFEDESDALYYLTAQI